MKREDLFEAIGQVEEELLDETAEPVRKFSGLHRWIGAAVAACLVIGVGALVIGHLPKRPDTQTPLANAEKIEQGIFIRYERVLGPAPVFTPYIEINEIKAEFRMQLEKDGPLLAGDYTQEGGGVTLRPTNSTDAYELEVHPLHHGLIMVGGNAGKSYMFWEFSAEINPKYPFADARISGAAICDYGNPAKIMHELNPAELAELTELLENLVVFQEDTPNPYGYLGDVYATGTMYSLVLYHEDGTETELQVDHTLILDGTSYIADDEYQCLLSEFIWRFREVIAQEEQAKEEAARQQAQAEAEKHLEAVMRQEEEVRLANEAELEYLGTGMHYRLGADSVPGYEEIPESALPLLTLEEAEGENPPRFRLILTDLNGHLTGSWHEDESGVHCTFDGGPEMELVRQEGSFRLIMVSCPDHPELEGAVFTPEIDHWLPFSGLEVSQIDTITVTKPGGETVNLSEVQIPEALALLQNVIVIQRDSTGRAYGVADVFAITKKNGTVIKAAPASTVMQLDGKRYRIAWDPEADVALTAFINALEEE